MLGSQQVGRHAALEEARRDAGVGGEGRGRPLGWTLVEEQQVGQVVDELEIVNESTYRLLIPPSRRSTGSLVIHATEQPGEDGTRRSAN